MAIVGFNNIEATGEISKGIFHGVMEAAPDWNGWRREREVEDSKCGPPFRIAVRQGNSRRGMWPPRKVLKFVCLKKGALLMRRTW